MGVKYIIMHKCRYCDRECKSITGLHKHERHCSKNPERTSQRTPINDHKDVYCQYCGKLCKSLNSLLNHERLCKSNPNRQKPSAEGRPRYDLRGKPSWNKGLTAITDERVANHRLKSIKGIYLAKSNDPTKYAGRAKTPETEKLRRNKISSSLKKNPNAGGLRKGSGIGKHGWYNGFYCDSTYELVYVIYNLDNNIIFKRSKLKYEYSYKNEIHKYYPDFELDDGSLVEIKGYYNEKVKAKLDSVYDRKIVLLLKEDLRYAFEYVEQHYTYQKLEDLYNGIKDGGYLAG